MLLLAWSLAWVSHLVTVCSMTFVSGIDQLHCQQGIRPHLSSDQAHCF